VTQVADLVRNRIEAALAGRVRYRYVVPRVEAEGDGWKIVSPNCSRSVDRAGGEISIAWLQPAGLGRWRLHAFDHRHGGWQPRADALALDAALAHLCADPLAEYWP
jgi:hypothetical protein